MLAETFPNFAEMRVVDLGGEVASWAAAPLMPKSLTLLNFGTESDQNAKTEIYRDTPIESITGDACTPPEALFEREFDLVYCNSVIEHVGGHYRRVQLADTVHRLAPHHWVQTPNRYFPVEPHFVAPGFQYLPTGLRAKALKHWPMGNVQNATDSLIWPETAVEAERSAAVDDQPLADLPLYHSVKSVMSFELLSPTELMYYFPQSTLLRERLAGLTKSLVAIK